MPPNRSALDVFSSHGNRSKILNLGRRILDYNVVRGGGGDRWCGVISLLLNNGYFSQVMSAILEVCGIGGDVMVRNRLSQGHP